MRISAIALDRNRGRPDLKIDAIQPGLNVFFGPPGSGKTALADLVAQALYGRPPAGALRGEYPALAEGPVVVDDGRGRYRLRRYAGGTSTGRLTVASLDGSRVDPTAVRGMLHGLSPSLAARIYAISFNERPQLEAMLSAELAGCLPPVGDRCAAGPVAGTAELLARREALAHDLESRIADGRRASRELRDRRGELDRVIQGRQEELSKARDQLHAVDTALAETDARLRYRRLETSIDQQWSAERADCELQLAELDEQIAHWRSVLADVGRRQAEARSEIARIAPGDAATAHADGRAWLAMARQLAVDLEGEVARLARASTSHQCVCGDAHPRLRPIVETLSRQLDVLASQMDRQRRAAEAAELQQEAEHLARTHAELTRQLEHLLGHRERLLSGTRPGRLSASVEAKGDDGLSFTAVDAEQLELRRTELEEQRYGLCSRIAELEPELDELRRDRDALDRQRATLLSARAIDQVQQELAAIERQLQQAAVAAADRSAKPAITAGLDRVSDFLAQLTGGEMIRAELSPGGTAAAVVNRAGEKVDWSSLSPAQQDQLYLSLCLALVTTCEGRGVRLPLVLDEPFRRLDVHDAAALATVLADLGRCGCQVLVLTGQRAAVERFTALGACVRDLCSLRRERTAA